MAVGALETILPNFILKVGEGNPIPEASSKKLIEWADANKMKQALEVLAKNSAREERMQTAPPEPALPRMPMDLFLSPGWSDKPDEAFHAAILRRLARLDVHQFDLPVDGPCQGATK